MITRGRPKKRAEDTDKEEQETTPAEEMEMIEELIEEDAQEDQQEETTQDKEMEQQAGDKGEVRGDPNLLKIMELMNNMNILLKTFILFNIPTKFQISRSLLMWPTCLSPHQMLIQTTFILIINLFY